jgi:hypothetical protein
MKRKKAFFGGRWEEIHRCQSKDKWSAKGRKEMNYVTVRTFVEKCSSLPYGSESGIKLLLQGDRLPSSQTGYILCASIYTFIYSFGNYLSVSDYAFLWLCQFIHQWVYLPSIYLFVSLSVRLSTSQLRLHFWLIAQLYIYIWSCIYLFVYVFIHPTTCLF